MSVDIDVYDDVCDDIGIAFCGALTLTEDGEKHFADVLDYEIALDINASCGTVAVVLLDNDRAWKSKLRKAKEFFYAAAGYVEVSKYKKWFKEVGC